MRTFFVALAATASLSLSAQTSQEEIIKDMFNMELNAFFTQTMNLSPEEEANFWPIYNEFRAESNKITEEWTELIRLYVEKYGQHTDEDLQKMLQMKFDVAKKRVKLEEKYYKKIQAKIDLESAVRFVQVQDYIETVIRFELLNELPVLPREREKEMMMEEGMLAPPAPEQQN